MNRVTESTTSFIRIRNLPSSVKGWPSGILDLYERACSAFRVQGKSFQEKDLSALSCGFTRSSSRGSSLFKMCFLRFLREG